MSGLSDKSILFSNKMLSNDFLNTLMSDLSIIQSHCVYDLGTFLSYIEEDNTIVLKYTNCTVYCIFNDDKLIAINVSGPKRIRIKCENSMSYTTFTGGNIRLSTEQRTLVYIEYTNGEVSKVKYYDGNNHVTLNGNYSSYSQIPQ